MGNLRGLASLLEVCAADGNAAPAALASLDPDAFQDPNFRLAIEDMRYRLAPVPEKALKAKLDEADNHRPMSMMQCMVAVIKQNLLSALRALGAGSSRTVTANLANDGVINADDNPAAAPKERRFMAIWP